MESLLEQRTMLPVICTGGGSPFPGYGSRIKSLQIIPNADLPSPTSVTHWGWNITDSTPGVKRRRSAAETPIREAVLNNLKIKIRPPRAGFGAPRRGEVYGADKPEYWNVGIVEYWERTTTKSLEMRVPQNRFVV